MATLKIDGKRHPLENLPVSTSASASGLSETYTSVAITMCEDTETKIRYHRVTLSREEAERVIRSWRKSLDMNAQTGKPSVQSTEQLVIALLRAFEVLREQLDASLYHANSPQSDKEEYAVAIGVSKLIKEKVEQGRFR